MNAIAANQALQTSLRGSQRVQSASFADVIF